MIQPPRVNALEMNHNSEDELFEIRHDGIETGVPFGCMMGSMLGLLACGPPGIISGALVGTVAGFGAGTMADAHAEGDSVDRARQRPEHRTSADSAGMVSSWPSSSGLRENSSEVAPVSTASSAWGRRRRRRSSEQRDQDGVELLPHDAAYSAELSHDLIHRQSNNNNEEPVTIAVPVVDGQIENDAQMPPPDYYIST